MKFYVLDDKNCAWNIVRDRLFTELTNRGFSVVCKGDPAELASILKTEEEPSFIVAAPNVRGIDNFSWCQICRSLTFSSRPYILLILEDNSPSSLINAYKSGADAFIVPPWDSDSFYAQALAGVRTFLHQQSLYNCLLKNGIKPPLVEPEFKLSPGLKEKSQILESAINPNKDIKPEEMLGKIITPETVESVVSEMLASIGLTESEITTRDPVRSKEFYNIVHFLIVPERELWLDLLLSSDHTSAMKLFEAFSGINSSEATASDILDSLGEVLNIIQGTLKARLRVSKCDVIAPVVPQVIPSTNTLITQNATIYTNKTYIVGDILLNFALYVNHRKVINKYLRSVAVGDVLAEPLKAPGNQDLVLINKGTLLVGRYHQKVARISEDAPSVTQPVIEPSPFGTMLESSNVLEQNRK